MLRCLLLALALFAAPSAAHAQAFVCPFVTVGWSQTWPGQQLSSASYDSQLQLLYVVFNNITAFAFSNVPTSVQIAFANTTNPMQTYELLVANTYHSILLAQQNNCPLMYENGAYIWTD